jgi:hypothetical protein
VKGQVLQAGFGVAPRGDVLRLQDQAGQLGAGFGEEAAVQHQPHGAAVAMAAAHLAAEGLELMLGRQAELLLQPGRSSASTRLCRVAFWPSVSAGSPSSLLSAGLACRMRPSKASSAMPMEACVKAL